jgi:hypothetical protein
MEVNMKRGLRRSTVWPLLSFGSGAITDLIKQLNARTGREGEALRELVRDFNQIDDMGRARGFPQVSYVREVFPHSEPHLGFDGPFMKRMKKIQAAYKSYRFVPWPAYPQKDGWKFHFIQPWSTVSNKSMVGWIFLAVIHDLAVAGQLRRVRECNYCRRWFFGRKDDQKFCPVGNCREKHWRTSAAGRAKRAAYMRRYRQGLGRMNRNALKAANNRKRKGRHSYRK